ncbi:MAG: hypothetical protein ACYS3N_18000, partial [Planctomycetota bacterium]
SSSTRKTQELCPLDDLKAKDAAAMRTQASLSLFIPNHLLSRQGKPLGYVLVYFIDITVEKCNEKNDRFYRSMTVAALDLSEVSTNY